jgi:hypothetical protein
MFPPVAESTTVGGSELVLGAAEAIGTPLPNTDDPVAVATSRTRMTMLARIELLFALRVFRSLIF